MDPPKNPSFSHPNHLNASSGVQDLVAADLSLQLGLATPQYPQLNSLEFNGQWATAWLQLDRPQQSPANSNSSVNQPRETQPSPNTSSDISQFRKLLRKVNYNIQSTSDDESFSSPMRKVKQDVSAVPKSKIPGRQSPEVETEADGSSQRIVPVNSPSKASWEHFTILHFPDEEFKKAFRMSKATFDMICYELESIDKQKDTKLPLIIPVWLRIAVCIWTLATGEPFSEVSKRFGLGISTCHNLVLEVCYAICNILMPKLVQWPNEEKMRDINRGFEMISGIPNVAGSIYTTHVPIIAPKDNVASYFNKWHTERNRKTSYSISVQGVVDFRGVFTDFCIGWPGSMTDDEVLERSALYRRANTGELLKDDWVVGNAGFPLMHWVLVPYAGQSLTRIEHAFNTEVGKVQSIAKEAFMRLKARWMCLQKNTEIKLRDSSFVVGACCVLHNLCEMREEGMNPELRFELFDDKVVPENPVRSIKAWLARDQMIVDLQLRAVRSRNVF